MRVLQPIPSILFKIIRYSLAICSSVLNCLLHMYFTFACRDMDCLLRIYWAKAEIEYFCLFFVICYHFFHPHSRNMKWLLRSGCQRLQQGYDSWYIYTVNDNFLPHVALLLFYCLIHSLYCLRCSQTGLIYHSKALFQHPKANRNCLVHSNGLSYLDTWAVSNCTTMYLVSTMMDNSLFCCYMDWEPKARQDEMLDPGSHSKLFSEWIIKPVSLKVYTIKC